MSKYSRNKETSSTMAPHDKFVGFWQRVSDLIVPYLSRAVLLLIGALIVGVIAWAVGQWLDSRKEKSTEMLTRAIKIYEAELLTDKDTEPGDDIPRFKTTKERAFATLQALDQLDKEYGSTPAALRGLSVRAGVLFDQGRASEAESLYKRFLDKKPREDALVALAQEGLGLCAESRNDLATALSAYQAASSGFYRERALLDEARVYVKQGNKQKAIEVYKDLLSKLGPTSPLREEVQNRLMALEP